MNTRNLLNIENLFVKFHTDGGVVNAVNGIDLTLQEGKTLGLVGETGAGKTTTALSILNLIDSPPGKIEEGVIEFDGDDLRKISNDEYRKVRGKRISMIFQDPMTSLNPVHTVVDQVAEVFQTHQSLSKNQAIIKAIEMLEMVRIPGERAFEYPHQFSGGMKQRVVIAMALACNPQLIIADEPTTALDVTIQAQVLELMKDLKEKYKTSMILITHDMGVVAETCETVAIMYAGEIVEYGTLEQIFDNPMHPYTNGLFGSIPNIDSDVEFLSPIKGLMPDPMNLPEGCKFHPRCKYADTLCSKENPAYIDYGDGHFAKCLIYEDRISIKEIIKYE